MTAEEYIKAHTRSCNCTLILGGKQEWLPVEDALAAVELAREKMKESTIKMLDAEKESTGIGLCEYDAGHENGRMEVIDSLYGKIGDMFSNQKKLNT